MTSHLEGMLAVTDESGVVLLAPRDRHRTLVEQEERFHGAFLGGTEHGRTMMTIGRLRTAPNPELDAIVRSHQPSLEPGRALFTMRVHRQRLLDESRVAHEVLAKYIAFIRYARVFPERREEQLPLWNDAVAAYPELMTLARAFADWEADEEFCTRRLVPFIYQIAKWVFATGELRTLENHRSFDQLEQSLICGDFIDATHPTMRLRILLEALTNEVCEELLNAVDGGYEQSALLATLRSRLPDIHAPDRFVGFSEIVRRSFIVGRNVAQALGLFSHQSSRPFSWSFDPAGFAHAEHIANTPLAQFLEDPALVIRYAPSAAWESTWPDEQIKPHAAKVHASKRTTATVAFCSLAPGRVAKLRLSLVTLERSRTPARLANLKVGTLKAMRSALERFPAANLVLCLPPPFAHGISTTEPDFIEALSPIARLVYWDPVGRLADLGGVGEFMPRTWFYYPDAARVVAQELAEGSTELMFLAPSPVGWFRLSGTTNAPVITITSVPSYFMEMWRHLPSPEGEAHPALDIIQEDVDRNGYRRIYHRDLTDAEADAVDAATIAYDVLYVREDIPPVPFACSRALHHVLFLSPASRRVHDRLPGSDSRGVPRPRQRTGRNRSRR